MRVEVVGSILGAPVARAKGGFVHAILVDGGDGSTPEVCEAYSETAHPAFVEKVDLNQKHRFALDVSLRSGQTLDDIGRAKNYAFQSVRLLGVVASQTARPDARQSG